MGALLALIFQAVGIGLLVWAVVLRQRQEIAEVTTRIGMQTWNTPYYDLHLVRRDGRQVPAGRAIRDKREAEWLADTMREALKAAPSGSAARDSRTR